MTRLEMKNFNMIRINRKAAKIALLPDKIDKLRNCKLKKYCPPQSKSMIERAKLTYSPLGKAFRKQTKTTEKQKDKQVEALRN